MLALPAVYLLVLLPLSCAKNKVPYLPLKAVDILNGTWSETLRLGEHMNCLSTNISYTRLIPHPTIKQRWTVPHSLISMNSVRCGSFPSNASDAQLDADSRMEYFLFDLVSTQRKAARARLTGPYMRLKGLSGQILTGLEMILGKDLARSSTFIGWEGSRERKCGDVRVPLNSFTILSRIGNQTFPVGKYIKGFEGSKFNLRENGVYHIMISPAGKNEAERFCPYQMPSKTRTYPIRACFPAEMTVQTRSGGRKTMNRLNIGDEVEYTDASGRNWFTPVVMFTHQSRYTISRFLSIHTASGRTLRLSHGHYVDETRKASDLLIGDIILLDNGKNDRVTQIEDKHGTGLYNPQTASGKINVNGVAVSTYTEAVTPASAHAALAPLRALWYLKFPSFISY